MTRSIAPTPVNCSYCSQGLGLCPEVLPRLGVRIWALLTFGVSTHQRYIDILHRDSMAYAKQIIIMNLKYIFLTLSRFLLCCQPILVFQLCSLKTSLADHMNYARADIRALISFRSKLFPPTSLNEPALKRLDIPSQTPFI